MGALANLKEKFVKLKRFLSGEPVEGETYEKSPDVKDLPHMKDADGKLIAVSSGNRELSPALSAKLNIQNSQGLSKNGSRNEHIDSHFGRDDKITA
ncbi:LAQU0S10e03774g1_1 [Lachancea quebecensis]|uniref:LAQU0S10e03774g1_1 n=1 Tax=Lachancea quebecensis TaxID=1654605 RepID=A0A0P1KWD5_9SACH|nr:LAQU0S10e03774g1_1 [Lachancea quebecensis]